MKWKSTYKKLNAAGDVLIKGLQDTLRVQHHNATRALSRSFRKARKQKGLILNVITNKRYWKIVNNGKAAFKPNLEEIYKWVVKKRIKDVTGGGLSQMAIAVRIARRISEKGIPSKPYVVWTEGNNLKRTDFAGVTKEKKKNEVVRQLTGGVVADVVSMIRSEIKRNTTIKK